MWGLAERSWNICFCIKFKPPITVTARSKPLNFFDRSNICIMFSYLTRGLDVCPRSFLFVVFCIAGGLAVEEDKKESHKISKYLIISEIDSKLKQARQPSP